ncbi:sugar phosphate isomerase/epimerase family protein [Fodinibius sediminis]|uniref:D-psicose/D-tagatose/L-ribulose 3-epimerase n=1 Tax=Fodinibius sediminis TaxID=1214077 RepID=A0A521BP18_9BACT|nr:sugar phosphate isomerase/epimerase family protein [Fodinibius sediminis]SMO48908.1 D-psicose/D-tagatose/L-ribulose 3-epimerase [Fodinibius sediminis]
MAKIGFNLLAWSAVVSDEMLPIAERLKNIGYDGIECFLAPIEKEVYRNFGKEVADLGLDMTCVMVLGPEENPISPSAEVRQKGLDRIKWAIDRADDMNAGALCGPFHSAFATFHDKAPDEDEYKRSAEVLAKAGEYAEQAGILLAPEAINRFECYLCNTMEQLVYLVEKVSHPSVKAHFDTHHANIEEKNIGDAIRRAAPVLGHVHISENDRGTPGSGHISWDETFGTLAEIGYDGWLTIEAFTRDDPDFANSINVWREYSKPWDVAENGYALIKEKCEEFGI